MTAFGLCRSLVDDQVLLPNVGVGVGVGVSERWYDVGNPDPSLCPLSVQIVEP